MVEDISEFVYHFVVLQLDNFVRYRWWRRKSLQVGSIVLGRGFSKPRMEHVEADLVFILYNFGWFYCTFIIQLATDTNKELAKCN